MLNRLTHRIIVLLSEGQSSALDVLQMTFTEDSDVTYTL
jgi:hypothetical protein